ncbi:MAG: hypothetical protein RSA74_14780, partial [Chryseobacterium sp.]
NQFRAKQFTKALSIFAIYRQQKPFIKPYRLMIYGTLFLAFLEAITAQVNAVVWSAAEKNVVSLRASNSDFFHNIGFSFFPFCKIN